MDKGWFDKPVRVVGNARGNLFRNISSTVGAAEFLLHDWPGDPGARKHLAARKACIAVLEGIKEARIARRAFEAAADDADILLNPIEPVTRGTDGPAIRARPKRKLKRDM